MLFRLPNFYVFVDFLQNDAFLTFQITTNDFPFISCIQVTCCAHGIHNLLKKLPELYPKVHQLVSEIKNIYAKAPTKRNRWKAVENIYFNF